MPEWLGIELAILAVLSPVLLGLVTYAFKQHGDGIRRGVELDGVRKDVDAILEARRDRDDKIFNRIDRMDRNQHLIMGKLGIDPVD